MINLIGWLLQISKGISQGSQYFIVTDFLRYFTKITLSKLCHLFCLSCCPIVMLSCGPIILSCYLIVQLSCSPFFSVVQLSCCPVVPFHRCPVFLKSQSAFEFIVFTYYATHLSSPLLNILNFSKICLNIFLWTLSPGASLPPNVKDCGRFVKFSKICLNIFLWTLLNIVTGRIPPPHC